MAFNEIYPNNKGDVRYSSDYFSDIADYEACLEWYEPGDGLMVFMNTENRMRAVYHRYGELLCLYDRFGLYCNVDCDNGDWPESDAAIREILQKEALDEGFPINPPHHTMTWRELKNALKRLPDDALDLEARVWLAPQDGCKRLIVDQDVFPVVTGITAYDQDQPVSNDNPLSLNIAGCC